MGILAAAKYFPEIPIKIYFGRNFKLRLNYLIFLPAERY
jgi:hypothetical protein